MSPDNLIWIDLEMTGLDPQADRIIEIATIVTDSQLHILAEGPVLAIHQSDAVLAMMDGWNQRQHGESGLVARVRTSTIDEAEAEARTLAFLSSLVPKGKSPMCGNSICQDRRFLARCMPTLEAARLEAIVELLLRHDIAVMSHAPSGPTPFPPLKLLHERGVRLCTGSDGVRDTWSPLNNGDMLERAYLLAYRSGWREDAGLELALHMATHAGAQVVGAPRYGLQVGCDADLVLVDAECGPEAVVMHPPRRLVLKRGRVVARDGRCVLSAIG